MKANEKNYKDADRQQITELLVSERRYRTVIEQSPLAIHVFEPDGRSLLTNASWNELWFLEEGEEPKSMSVFEDEQLHAAGLTPYVKRGVAGETVAPEPLYYDPVETGREGDPRWLQPFVYPVKDEEGRVREVTLIIEDVTERKALEETLSYRAFHDPLTGLPNRALFLNRLGHALERSERHGGKVAVLFMDLDNFKYVNDSLGHDAGDRLVREVADRLGAVLRPGDTAARFGGDEFVVLLEDVAGAVEAARVAERIARDLGAPFDLNGHEVFVTTSTGIVLGGPGEAGGTGAQDLLRKADVAMYWGKEGGKNRYEVFEEAMGWRPIERLGLENDLRRAIERDEFKVCYQPIVGVDTGRVFGMEALVRWEHPERGLVMPSEFVPLAEETGMIVPIGRWVLEEACRQAKRWQELYPSDPPLMIGVNLSAKQLHHPGLIGDIEGVLRESGLDAQSLTLEITESAVVGDEEQSINSLRRLSSMGVRLALDDFGTGYSSLSYLKRLPAGLLKIDRSFVQRIELDPEDAVLISGVVQIARGLDMLVVGEGVETPEQLERLKALGCDLAQGYYFAKPFPSEAAGALIAQDRCW